MKPAPNVGVRTYMTINEIDDVHQKFTLDFELYFQWEDPEHPNLSIDDSNEEYEDISPPAWVPSFFICDTAQNEVLSDFKYKKRGGWYFGEVNWLVTINVTFDVHYFPFDRQILEVGLVCDNGELIPFDITKGIPVSYKKSCTNSTVHYKLKTFKIENFEVMIEIKRGLSRSLHSIYITRSADFYLANIVFVMFLIVLVSASVYIIDVNDFGGRIGVLLTSILTAVAFKFVTITFVPQVPYLTTLDIYNLISFAALAVLILQSVILHYTDEEYKETFNENFIFGFLILWVGLHLFIFIGSKLDIFSESWERVLKSIDEPPVILPAKISLGTKTEEH